MNSLDKMIREIDQQCLADARKRLGLAEAEPPLCAHCHTRPAIKTGSDGTDWCERCLRGTGTVRVTSAHIGRNDPCPCGSGKKFKRCCVGRPLVTHTETI